MNSHPLKLVPPKVPPVLDPHFRPAVLANAGFQNSVRASGQPVPVRLALEQADGTVFSFETALLPENHPDAAANFPYLERLLKFLWWSRGGFRAHFDGPPALGRRLQEYYAHSPTGQFDAEIMGRRIYERPFEILVTGQIPAPSSKSAPLGRHWEGCRIGFDLGASDRKVAAVMDGKCVFSDELVWDPVPQSDPQWHFDQILDVLKMAAGHLPRVDAIGGSSAGVYVNNQVKVASLFRGVPPGLFQDRVKNIFLDLQKALNNVPFEVANDGEVTALAGSMSIGKNGVLGIALGSSQAAGYVNPQGNITAWLDELAFAPVDYNPNAPVDEWSGDHGCGVQYFSQQCVGRLIPAAGIAVPPGLPLPEQLKLVQKLMDKEDSRARKIFQTIGVYLGYALAHYSDFYEFNHVLILGRVTTGAGGDIILHEARHVLEIEFPDLSSRLDFHIPNETEKRHGQAMAAASLPAL